MAEEKLQKYYYAIGRRKTSTATIRLFEGVGQSFVNEKKIEEVYKNINDRNDITFPLLSVNQKDAFHFTVRVLGGGVKGQIGAIRLALSRALVKFNQDFKTILKENKLLTRDSRMVERKKPGLKKARKAPQFSKR